MDNHDPVDQPTGWEESSVQGGACCGGCLLFVILFGGITTLAGYVVPGQVASTFALVVALVVSIALPAWLYGRWRDRKAQENRDWRLHRVREEEAERRRGRQRRRRRF
jgi:membrane protein implicated in regulation of membrane protease activity